MDNLKEKINQLFILGYEGGDFRENSKLVKLLANNLGGVIFFTQNILDKKQFKNQINLIKKCAKSPLFLSIDEEGGRVERFENLNKNCPNGKKYLSPKYITQKGEKALFEQTQSICEDLKYFGINMNFAPVLDVNSNPHNPIIGERAYSDNPKIVADFGLLTAKIYTDNGIIPVGKHFPGHGDTKKDSHLELPIVDLSLKDMEEIHLYPFKKAIENKIPALMIAHVHYNCFDPDTSLLTPASASENVLGYLINNLKYDGVIISDDMEMEGIKKYSPIEAVIKMLKTGVNCFIYRNCTDEVVNLLNNLEKSANNDTTIKNSILRSYEKIMSLKKRFLI